MQAVLPHGLGDPLYLVLRPRTGDACHALLDPRGAFVVELPDSLHVWQVRPSAMQAGRAWLQSCLQARPDSAMPAMPCSTFGTPLWWSCLTVCTSGRCAHCTVLRTRPVYRCWLHLPWQVAS